MPMRTRVPNRFVRLIASAVVAADLASLPPEALAQVREVVVAPKGTPVTPVPVVGAQTTPNVALPPLGPTLAPLLPRSLPLPAGVRSLAGANALTLALSSVARGRANGSARAEGTGASDGNGAKASPLARLLGAPSAATIRAFFDGGASSPAEAQPVADASLDDLQVFIVQDGSPARRATLGTLGAWLMAEPRLAASLNAKGKVRVVVDVDAARGGLAAAGLARARTVLLEAGVTAPVQSEKIAVDWNRVAKPEPELAAPPTRGEPRTRAPAAEAPKGTATAFERYLARPLMWPFREAAFLARAMRGAYTKPQFWEVIGGLGTEGISFAMTAVAFTHAITFAHPVFLGASLALLLAQNAFHGFWLNTWNNFQDSLNKYRGPTYQTVFNWTYFQAGGVVYRALAWAAHPAATVAPWTWSYWRAIGFMSVVGTFIGVLGYNGLNRLYDKGRLNRWQRSALQQGRNLLFLGTGPLFAAGILWLFWPLFWALQSLDVVLFLASLFAKSRPVLYVAHPGVAASPEFKAKYPATTAVVATSGWGEAKAALAAQPPVMLVLWLYRLARRAWRYLASSGPASSKTSGPAGSPPPKT